jgi:hypothetical protein
MASSDSMFRAQIVKSDHSRIEAPHVHETADMSSNELLRKYAYPSHASPQISIYFRRLLVTGAFSDLIIACPPREFKVHKNIMCSISATFMAACSNAGWSVSLRLRLLDKCADQASRKRTIIASIWKAQSPKTAKKRITHLIIRTPFN